MRPQAFTLSPYQTWLFAGGLSIFAHLITGGGISIVSHAPHPKITAPVKIRVAEVVPQAKETPPKPKAKEKPAKQSPAPNQPVPLNQPTTTQPVQGVTKDSLAAEGGMAAPVGNTLMTGDVGKRLKDVDALRGDMSAPAKLIAATLRPPPYTDEALDAMLEGSFVVDVYVNLDGSVREAELRKKIGYGMDSRVLDAVRSSKFTPRKNKFGVSEDGWTELKFTLVIP